MTVPDVVDYAYDLFGNMTSREMTQGNPPAGLEFTHQFDRNRIIDTGFGYDDGGNLMRLTGKLGASQPVGALWDHQSRMTAFVEGESYSASGKPAERYQYDGTGHRLVRVGRDGIPVISLRDSEGRTLAEYLAQPGETLPHLNRNFIYGQGQLLVERVTADDQLKLMGNQPPTGSTSVPLTVVEGAGAPTYAVDVRTASGPVSHLTGVTLDANNRFLLDQTNLAPGETNWVRIKAEGDEGAVYSRAVRVVLNPDAVPEGENQIRAVSLSRSGTDLVVRWGLAAENGKKTRIYFKRSDNGAVTLLTQVALNAGVRSYTLSAQGLSSPCGDFHLGQVGSDDVESPLTPALFFAGIDFGIGHEGGCIDDPPTTPEPPKWSDYYHARDHLGTLRLVTDISGYVQEAHDYEPFGLELVTPGESPGTLSTRKFTGHERDASTGLDYMMARYYPASMARFLSVDPASGSIKPQDPQTWNGFGYVSNNPLAFIDPTGEELQVSGTEEDKKKFVKIAENGLFGKKVEISPEGNVTLASNGLEGPPTKEQAALESTLNQAIDNPKTTSLSLVHHDADVLIDSFATGRGDMTDIQCYGQGPGASAAGFLGHFVAEQFKRQVEGITDYRTAHQAATAVESAITGFQRGMVSGEIRRTPESGSLIGTQTVQYTRGIEKVNVTTRVKWGDVKKVERY